MVAYRWFTAPCLWEQFKPLARRKRREPVAAEKQLWRNLRGKRLGGFRFRRQHAIDRFIVDFYCAETRLVVEVDGPTHDGTIEADAQRQRVLEALGFRVLRFRNEEVFEELGMVLRKIAEVLKNSTPPPTPLR